MALHVAEHQDVEQRIGDAVEPGLGAFLPAVRKFAAPGKAGFCKSLAQRPALAELEQKALLKLFIDAGNADKECRGDLTDIERDRIDRLGETDGAAEHELHHLAVTALRDMAERQVAHRLKWLVGD